METDHLILREDVLRTVTVSEQEANLKYLEQKAIEQTTTAEEHADAADAAQVAAAQAQAVAIASATAAAQAKSDAAASATQAISAKQVAEAARDTAVSGADTVVARAAEAAESAGVASGAAASALTDAETAATQAGTATAQAGIAAAQAGVAAMQAGSAAASAVVAQTAADQASAVGNTYIDIASGLAATVSGKSFAVFSGDYVNVYKNNSGVAILLGQYYAAPHIDASMPPGYEKCGRLHAFIDGAGNDVGGWDLDGHLYTGAIPQVDVKADTAYTRSQTTFPYTTKALGFSLRGTSRFAPASIGAIGNSIAGQSGKPTDIGGTQWKAKGLLQAISAYYGQAVYVKEDAIFARGGKYATHIRNALLHLPDTGETVPAVFDWNTTFDPDRLADYTFLHLFENDVLSAEAWGDSLAAATQIIEATRHRTRLIVCDILMSNAWTAATADKYSYLNGQLQTLAVQYGLTFVKVSDYWQDTSVAYPKGLSTGNWIDTIHPTPKGALALSRDRLVPAMDRALSLTNPLKKTARLANVTQAWQAMTNFISNWKLSGTAGTVGAGVTGTVPDGWNATNYVPSGSGGTVISAVARADVSGAFWQQLHYTSTSGSGDTGLNITVPLPAGVVAGDEIELICDVDMDNAPVGFRGVTVQIRQSGTFYGSGNLQSFEVDTELPIQGRRDKSNRVVVGAGVTSVDLYIKAIATLASTAVDFTVRFSLPVLRKVEE